MPFRVVIALKNSAGEHEAYFQHLPTEEAVIKSIRRDAKLAPEYWQTYEDIEMLASNFPWPTSWISLAAIGSPAYFASNESRLPKDADGYVRIHKFEFTE